MGKHSKKIYFLSSSGFNGLPLGKANATLTLKKSCLIMLRRQMPD